MIVANGNRVRLRFVLLLLFILQSDAKDDFTPPSSTSLPSTLPQEDIYIEKDDKEPSSRIIVKLTPGNRQFNQYIAKVIDLSPENVRDAIRTFLASGSNAASINIHNLHPGHHYKVMLVGRKENASTVVKEKDVIMHPRAPDFGQRGASIVASETNITMKTTLLDKALQDQFLVDYRQLDSDQIFPRLEIASIEGQKQLELFLNRLNPGRDYDVSIIAVKDSVKSRPWKATLTTMPLKVSSLTAIDASSSCVNLTWTLPPTSGVDHFEVAYGPIGGEMAKESAASSTRSFTACDNLTSGTTATFSVTVVKTSVASIPVTVEHTTKPRPPSTLNVRADTWSSKYRIWADLAEEGRVDGCSLTVVSESLHRVDATARVEGNETVCEFLQPLKPGERYELSVQTNSLGMKSSKVQRSLSLPPAFDIEAFGLNIQEARGGLEIAWPSSEVAVERLKELWTKLVGDGSLLHVRVSPYKTVNDSRTFESSPASFRPIFVPGLVMGSCYRVQMYTVTPSGIVSEHRYDESIRVSPSPLDVSLHSVSRTVASLRLSALQPSEVPSSSSDCQTLVIVNDEHGLAVFDRHLPLPINVSDIPLDGLRPYHKYTTNAQVLCGSTASTCPAASRTMRPLSFVTRQDRPGPVQSPSVSAINSYSVQLRWLQPSLPNGIVTHYVVEIKPENGDQWSVNVGASTRQETKMEAVVDGLKGGHTYSFLIKAVTEAGMGDPPALSDAPNLTMPVHAPPRPTIPPVIVDSSITSSTLTLILTPTLFDSRNGPIIRYSILVSEVSPDGHVFDDFLSSSNSSYTWAEVQQLEKWPTYTAAVFDREPQATLPTEVEIGVDSSCLSLPLNFVCNGPIKPSTKYRFRVRLYTTPTLHTDSPLSTTVSTDSSAPPLTTWALVGSLFLVVVAVAIVGCIFICSSGTRDKRPLEDPSKEGQWAALRMMMTERAAECLARLGLDSTATPITVSHTNGVSAHPRSPVGKVVSGGLQPGSSGPRRCGSLRERTGVDHRLDGLPSLPRPIPSTIAAGVDTNRTRPIALDRFAEHVRIMSADSDFRFSEEYELLRNIGLGASSSAAESAVNRAKNRFTNILPYDHSRVKLIAADDEEGEDYINANFMPGAHSRREFIAAQGPLPSTRDAFWRMVFEQQCPAIIALTKCIEKGRDKCHQYWPDKEHMSVLYGDIEVTMLTETETEEMVIRELLLTPLSNPFAARSILHMHYMAWPDFGVPESPKGIVRFAHLFRQDLPRSSSNKPVVVHCSAGVGRSGTFMALDRLMYIMATGKPLDVYGTVYEMRLERCHMVQNEQQYIFLHHALLYCLREDTSTPPLSPPQFSTFKPNHANHAFEDDEGIAESGL